MFLSAAAWAQWNPSAAQWGKSDPRDLRVMAYNVYDTLCSSNNKVEGLNDWTGLARIVAAMKPDVLILEETADNSGNNTGSGVDSVENLTTTLNLFLRGGNDPFKPGNPPVTAYVQKYAANFDLPYVFVSASNDGFNRNALLSRYPFADLNGDGKSTSSDIFFVLPHLYAPGGNGGIRGFLFAEINLPEDQGYCGNLVVGGAHLKAGSSDPNDHTQRITAARNVSYFVDHFFNGAGMGVPDPFSKIGDSPPANTILDAFTPVILGGDWNEDELTNNTVGPTQWLTAAEFIGELDGTDRDGSDMLYDDARETFTNNRATIGSTAKLDYISWQDSIATLRRSFIFYSSNTPLASMPAEILGLLVPTLASGLASDHRPVLADFILPRVPNVEWQAQGGRYLHVSVDANGTIPVALQLSSVDFPCLTSYLNSKGQIVGEAVFLPGKDWGEFNVFGEAIIPNTNYEIRVQSENGAYLSYPTRTWIWGDTNQDEIVNLEDLLCVLSGLLGDFNRCPAESLDLIGSAPGVVDLDDVMAVLEAFSGAEYPDSQLCD